MECYYARRNNNRMYRNRSVQMERRGMRSGSNINDSCLKDEKKDCNCANMESRCGCGRSGNNNTRMENSCGCNRSVNNNTRTENGCGCNRSGNNNTRTENGCGCNRSGSNNTRTENGCGCGRMRNHCAKERNGCGCERTGNNCKRDENNSNRSDCDCNKGEDNSCYPCKKDEWKNSPVGMGYVPWQCFRMVNDMRDGFETGTIFKELDKPFEIGFCARRCGCQ